MKIGIFTDTLFHNPNGVSTSVFLQCRELIRLGHEITIVAPSGSKECKGCLGEIRVPSFSVPILEGLRLALPVGTKRLKNTRFDIIHSHTPFALGLTAGRIASSQNIPHVMTFHTDFQRYTHYLPVLRRLSVSEKIASWWLLKAYRGAQLIVAPSRYAREVVRGIGLDNEVEVIPSGIDADLLKACIPAYDLWPRDALRVLCVGRLSEEKNFATAIKAIGFVPNAHLVIIGSGPLESSLRELAARLGVLDRFKIVSSLSYPEMGGAYKAADVVLSASGCETQGLSVWEAQALATPVIAASAGGTIEAVLDGESGFLAEPDDPVAFARCLMILENPSIRARMGRTAEAWVSCNTSRICAEKTLDSYKRMVARRKGFTAL